MIEQKKYQCKICGKRITKRDGQFCNSCQNRYYSALLKKQAIEYKGGKCEICGYNKNIAALDFHHINPQEKEFEISQANVSKLELIKSELDKCMLLCANCHREIHSSNYDQLIKTYESLVKNPYEKKQPEEPLKRKYLTKAQRIEVIKKSSIDFSQYGWAKQLEPILGIRSAPIVRWMKRHMPEFYKDNCYREKQDCEIDQNLIIQQYQKGRTIAEIADEQMVDVSRIQAILKKHNINRKKPSAKKISMIDKKTNNIIQNFNSIKEASIFCKNNAKHKIESPFESIIAKRISECANGRRLSAYGYKWKFIELI